MISLSQVEWGPIDAIEDDKHFSEKWVEPRHVKRCLRGAAWIVSGEKGSGKTAIRKAITNLYKDQYVATVEVDFDGITFGPIYKEIREISRTTNLPQAVTLSHYWQYAIIVEMMNACAQQNPIRYSKQDMPARDERSVSLNERILSLLEQAWNKIDEFTGVKRSTSATEKANLLASSNLTAEFVQDLSTFPLNQKFILAKKRFFQRLSDSGDKVMLILDGFDRLKNDEAKPEAINVIFSALVDAIRALKADPSLPEGLFVKLFLPHDRYLNLNLRDSDKLDTMHSSIRWSRDTLQEFVGKRIEASGRAQGNSFAQLWRQVFPDTVTNSHYGLTEDSFDYIIRHTMYRPRQVQIHLEELAISYEGMSIDPSMVPKSIVKSSKRLAEYFIKEYELDHPRLADFILSFRARENIMEYRVFRDALSSAIKRYHPSGYRMSLENKVDDLYSMGLFGLVNFLDSGDAIGDRYCPPTREGRRHYVDFFYREPRSKISGYLRDDDLVALHPIFVEYASLKPHPTIIVG